MTKFRLPHPTLLFIHKGLILLLFSVVLSVTYRYCWLDIPDPFKCGALMNEGKWADPGRAWYTEGSYQVWQPPGCLMREYKQKEFVACLQSKRLVFIGDSTTRQIFWATAKKLDENGARGDMIGARKHADLEFRRHGVQLEFIWDPYLNSSRFHEELEAYRNTPHAPTENGETGDSPAIIFVGGGLWFARHVHVNTLREFRDSIDNISSYMNPPTEAPFTNDPWSFVRNHVPKNLLLVAPVQVPEYDFLSPSRSETITAEKIDAMNDYLQQLSEFQGADIVWSFHLMTWRQRAAYEQSGLHVVDNVAGRRADVLLNLRCNAEAASSQGYPYDRTCCSNYRRPGWMQWAALFGTLVILPLLVWVTRADHRRTWLLPSPKVLRALLTFLLAVVYCFFADRTNAFEKMHKQRSTREFIVLSVVPLSLGLLLVRRSAPAQVPVFGSGEQKTPAQSFLSRHQTEEWKGWMQLVILSYHYSGTSTVFWVYVAIRLLVASYLFMTGFGHTVYFYRKDDYSLRRVAGVLIRLNLLNCVLPYMMRTDYQLYYFAPLVSFWFMVIYATMRVRRSRNGSLSFIFGKIVMSAIIVTGLTKIYGPLEVASAIVRHTCRLNWDAEEWRFRVSLDMFIVYVGMSVAILFVEASSSPRSQQIESILKNQHIYRLRLALPFLSFAIFYTFANVTRLFPDKYEYNRWHPFISFIPIIAFTIIRNSHRYLRDFHSPLFAWLGRCSLETFTLQFHIWMAGDTKGLLSLGIFDMWNMGKWCNFVVVTTIFIFISWRVAGATHALTQCIVRGEVGWGGEEGLPVEESGQGQGGSELSLRKSHDSGRLALTTTGGSSQGESRIGDVRRIITMCWRWLFMKSWKCEDLPSRLGVILVAMWFFNVVSIEEDNSPHPFSPLF